METKIKQQELEYVSRLRENYIERETKKLDQLMALEKRVNRPTQIFAYTFGIIAALIFGVGMCLAMKVIGNLMVLGIIVGIVGMGLCVGNYFIYKAMLRSRKIKYGSTIIELSNELLNEHQA